MSKRQAKGKNEPRRKHVRTKQTLVEAVRPVRAAVVTAPRVESGRASLRRDVELVKSAVLYADKVELLGAASAMIHSICLDPASKNLGLAEMLRYAKALGTPVDLDPQLTRFLPQISKMVGNLSQLPPELQTMVGGEFSEIADALREGQLVMDNMRDDLLKETGADELVPAVEDGVLEVASLRMDMESAIETVSGRRSDDEFLDPGLEMWMEQVRARLTDYRTRVIFDDESGDLVRSMLSEGVLEPHEIGLRLAGDAALGTGFVARLPTFGEAPMDELLDVRKDKELSTPLVKYRRAVGNMADKVTRTVGHELHAQVEHLWTTDVHPALVELDETFHQHAWFRELARLARKDIGIYLGSGSAIYVGLGATTDLASIALSAVSAAPKAVQMGVDGLKARQDGRDKVRKHDLFYLYELNRKMR